MEYYVLLYSYNTKYSVYFWGGVKVGMHQIMRIGRWQTNRF